VKINRLSKIYEAGNGSSWLVQFENDLKQGIFGR